MENSANIGINESQLGFLFGNNDSHHMTRLTILYLSCSGFLSPDQQMTGFLNSLPSGNSDVFP